MIQLMDLFFYLIPLRLHIYISISISIYIDIDIYITTVFIFRTFLCAYVSNAFSNWEKNKESTVKVVAVAKERSVRSEGWFQSRPDLMNIWKEAINKSLSDYWCRPFSVRSLTALPESLITTEKCLNIWIYTPNMLWLIHVIDSTLLNINGY